jgi:hypothetical protein
MVRDRLGDRRVAWLPEQRLVVEQTVEQLHGQQVTQTCASTLISLSCVSGFPTDEVDEALAKVRKACLILPETSERLSHGGPAFFIRGKKCFVMFLDNHHDDGRLAIWCAAPDGVQVEMVDTEPERYFRPPYVGHLGWLGVQLPGIDQAELGAICREAFASVAPPSLLKVLNTN